MHTATAHAGKTQRRLVAAVGGIPPTGTAFAEADAPAAHAQWRRAADQIRPKVPKSDEWATQRARYMTLETIAP